MTSKIGNVSSTLHMTGKTDNVSSTLHMTGKTGNVSSTLHMTGKSVRVSGFGWLKKAYTLKFKLNMSLRQMSIILKEGVAAFLIVESKV